MGKIIALYSGGLDSTVMLSQLLSTGWDVTAFSVNYGHKHACEITAASEICYRLGVRHRIAYLPQLADIMGASALTQVAIAVPQGVHYEDPAQAATVVPNRNMVLISLACAEAITQGAGHVAFACHKGDAAVYADCRPAFATAMQAVMTVAMEGKLTLFTPFLGMTKREIVALGRTLGSPLEATWSCYLGKEAPCGLCGACIERQEAMA